MDVHVTTYMLQLQHGTLTEKCDLVLVLLKSTVSAHVAQMMVSARF